MRQIVLFTLIVVLFFTGYSQITGFHEQFMGISLVGNWSTRLSKSMIFPLEININETEQQEMNITNRETIEQKEQEKQNQEKQGEENTFEKQQRYKAKFLQFFNSTEGHAEAQFYELPKEGSENLKVQFLFIRIYENKYLKDNVIELRMPLNTQIDPKNNIQAKSKNQLQKKKSYVSARLYTNQSLVVTINFQVKLELELMRNLQKQIDQITIKVISESIDVELSLSSADFSLSYFYVLLAINFAQILLITFAKKDRRALYGTSQWLILQVMFSMLFQAFIYVKISQEKLDTNLSLLLANGFLNILTMPLLLRKYEKVFEKFKNAGLFFRMIVAMILYLYFAGSYYQVPKFWMYQSMLFLWQITHSIINGGFVGVTLGLILVVLLNRIPILYFIFTDNNLLKSEPQPQLGKIVIGILCIHIFIIFLQKKLGSRFFIPKVLIPDYHKYIRKDYYGGYLAKEECSICLLQLRESADSKDNKSQQKGEQASSQQIEVDKDRKIEFAMTPCRHMYHKKCLQDWLETNLVCPMCKRELPPFNWN